MKEASFRNNAQVAWELVLKFFEGDYAKAMRWWRTDNPLLGGQAPFRMVLEGRGAKLLKFVSEALCHAPPETGT